MQIGLLFQNRFQYGIEGMYDLKIGIEGMYDLIIRVESTLLITEHLLAIKMFRLLREHHQLKILLIYHPINE